jgi:hypothetical protein
VRGAHSSLAAEVTGRERNGKHKPYEAIGIRAIISIKATLNTLRKELGYIVSLGGAIVY